jgi:hypothetical protein
MDRRDTLAWLARALALGVSPTNLFAGPPLGTPAVTPPIQADAEAQAPASVHGYGPDPDLANPTIPWPLTLTPDQRRTVTRLADLLLPADERSPAASALGVPEFVDEWVSAPYPLQRADRNLLEAGLRWLEARAGGRFPSLDAAAAGLILDEICDARSAPDDVPAAFFGRVRQICLIGYYSSNVGMADLGYVGNQPSTRFTGPPTEILARLGLGTGSHT